MRFGSLTSLSSTLGSLGLDSDIAMLDSARGVEGILDALSRSSAALHHMAVENGEGVDKTPTVYRQLIRANLAGKFIDLIGSLGSDQPLKQGYISPFTTHLSLYQDDEIINQIILTVVWRGRRMWVELLPNIEGDSNLTRAYKAMAIGYRPCQFDSKESTTDLAYAGEAMTIGSATGSSVSVSYQAVGGSRDQAIVSAFVYGDRLYILTWRRSDNTCYLVDYTMPHFTSEFGFYMIPNSSFNPAPDYDVFPVIDSSRTDHTVTTMTTGSFKRNGTWLENQTFLQCSHFLCVPPAIATTSTAADKLIVATLIASRMNQNFAME